MSNKKDYQSIPLSFNRKAVIASASVTREKNAIHSFSEVDITTPRKLMQDHFEKTGQRLSFTAYIVTCLAKPGYDSSPPSYLRHLYDLPTETLPWLIVMVK